MRILCQAPKPKSIHRRSLRIEPLEIRSLLTVTLSDAALDIAGTLPGNTSISDGTLQIGSSASATTGATLTVNQTCSLINYGTLSGSSNTTSGGTIVINPGPPPSPHNAPSGASTVINASPNSPYTLQLADFGFTDPNDSPPDAFTAVTITTVPSSGSLLLSGQLVAAGQSVSTTDIAAGNLEFYPVYGGAAHPRLTFQVQDNGYTGSYGANLDPAPKTLVFSLAPNNAPVASDDSYAVIESNVLDQALGTHLQMVSQPNYPVGGGQSYFFDYSGPYVFSASRNYQNGVTISLVKPLPGGGMQIGPSLVFAAPGGASLTPGTYTNTQDSLSLNGPNAVLNVSAGGINWSQVHFTGQFTINQVDYDYSGNVLDFDATFVQYGSVTGSGSIGIIIGGGTSNNNNNALTGRIKYQVPAWESMSVLQNDTDVDADPLTAVLVAGPQHGALVFNGDGGFIYTPDPGFHGTDTFQYKANDGIADGNAATVSIDVEPFGRAPLGKSATINVPPGPSYALKTEDFGFTDPNDTPADNFAGAVITTLPSGANLTLNGAPVAAGDFIAAADIAAGNLVLSPSTGRPHISFTFQVQDDTGTDYGGANLDPDPKTLTFNCPPVAQDDSYTVNENQTLDEAFLGNHLQITTTTTSDNSSVIPSSSTTDIDGSGGQCVATGNGNSLTFTYPPPSGNLFIGNYTVKFAAPGDSVLTPGDYTGAKQSADADSPGFSFNSSWFATGDDTSIRQFTILEAAYDGSGNILRFDATFQITYQSPIVYPCDGSAAMGTNTVSGRLQYNASARLGTGILDNDSDADGDPLSLISLPQQISIIGGMIIIINPGPQSLTVVTGPQHGGLTLDRDGGFIYNPSHDYYGPDSFQYKINDGTAESNVATVTINVIQASQAPSGASGVVALSAGAPSTLKTADFGFSDTDDSPPDAFTRVKITTLPTSGNLTLSGAAVVAGQFIDVADIDAGKLVFTEPPGGPRGSFTFQVEDSGSTANGGAILDPNPKSLTFNTPPVAADDAYSVNENQVLDQAFLGNHLRLVHSSPGASPNIIDVDGSGTRCSGSGTNPLVMFIYNSSFYYYYGQQNVVFTAPSGSVLAPGVYTGVNATDDGSAPGLSINGFSYDVSDFAGQFTIIEATYDASGNIQRFDATFQLQNPATGESISGHLQYHATAVHGTSILANDTDADGDQLSASATPVSTVLIGSGTGSLGSIQIRSGTISLGSINQGNLVILPSPQWPISLVSQPQHGLLTLDQDGGFIYTPNHDYYGTDSFQYTVSDGLAVSNVATVTINVVHVSQAPAGTSGVAILSSGAPYVLKTSDFGFTDPDDAPPDDFIAVEITTLPATGSLTLDGAPVSAGQFVAVADIAANKLVYTPGAGGQRASITFQVQDSGSTANGGVVLDPAPKTLIFDFPPVAHDDAYTVNENSTLDETFDLSRIEFTYGYSPYATNTVYDGNLDKFTASGDKHSVTIADPQAAFYSWAPGVSFQFSAPDNAELLPGEYVSVPGEPNLGHMSWTCGSDTEDIYGNFRVNQAVYDAAGNIQQFDVTFWSFSTLQTGHIQYRVSAPGAVGILQNDQDADGDTLTPSQFSAPQHGTLTLEGYGFVYTPDHLFYGVDSFQYLVNDGLTDGNVATVTINVNHVSQAPSGTSGTLNIAAGQPYVLKKADFGFTDPNDSPPDSFTGVVIASLPESGGLLLSGMPVEEGQFVSAADIAAGLLTFTPAILAPGSPHAAFTFQVQDSGSTDNGGVILDHSPKTMTFNVMPVANDDSYTINQNEVLDQSLFITRLTMTSQPGDWVGGGQTYDFNLSDGAFYACVNYDNGVSITFQGYSHWWGLNFAAPGNMPLAPGIYTGATQFTFQAGGAGLDVSGDGRGSGTLTGQFTVLQVVYGNDGQVLHFDATFEQHSEGADPALTGRIQFNAPSSTAVTLFNNDADSDGDALSAVLITGPQHGVLALDPNGGFVYTPNQGFYGADSFQYKENDGTADSNVATATINVLRQSQAPSGTSGTIGIPPAALYTLKVADFGFSDAGDSPPDNFTRVQITTLPTTGRLTLDNILVTAGQFVSVNDITAGKLAYGPPAAATGTGCGSFTFQVEDSGSTDNNGVILDPAPKTLTFNIIPTASLVPSVPGVPIGPHSAMFKVMYSDLDDSIQISTIDNYDILVTGPNGYNQLATLISFYPSTGGSNIDANYWFSAPGTGWTQADAGIYTVSMQSDQVQDAGGYSVSSGTLGTLSVKIPPPTFDLSGPTSGTYAPGQPITITWNADYASGNGLISLCLDTDTTLWNGNERWIEVDKAAAVSGGGSFTFDFPDVAPGKYYIGGYMYDKVSHVFTDSHIAAPITILPPAFTLTGPTSGTYAPGDPITITWNAANVSANSVITLCLDQDKILWNGNERWVEIDKIAAADGDGSYTFDPAGFAPGKYFVGGYMYDKITRTFTESYAASTITIPAPTFAITGPASGTYAPGQTVTITWTANNVSSNSVISLCLDQDTKLWNRNERWIEVDKIAASNGDGSYTFDPGNFLPGTYYIGGYVFDRKLLTFTEAHASAPITIPAPTFTISGPTSGTYAPGQQITINWNVGNVSSNSVITLCLDQDTKLWNRNERWIEVDKIAASNGAGSYTFDPGNFLPGTYYIGGYVYDKKLSTFTQAHASAPITISDNSPDALTGAFSDNVLTTKKKESAAIDLIMQNQGTWLAKDARDLTANY